jgi:glycosyltransferase involved in cell wall biosynthesis
VDIALFMSSLDGGGVERSFLTLARALVRRGHRLDLLVCKPKGPLRVEIPEGVRLVPIGSGSAIRGRWNALRADPDAWRALLGPVLLPWQTSNKLRHLGALADYLRREQPHALLSAMTYPNLVALWAHQLADVATRVVLTEHNTLSRYVAHYRWRWRWRFLPPLVARTYRRAQAIVAVSRGVASDLVQATGLPHHAVTCIYNPNDLDRIASLASYPTSHPWVSAPGGPPLVVAMGRLVPQKDFTTLLRAFACLRATRRARLVVMGEGPQRGALERQTAALGVREDVDFTGFDPNPYAILARADLFVLSSAWEGLGNVLVEALACGTPVVSTRCPSGPAEILEDGVYGALVAVGDHVALAAAMASALDTPADRDALRSRARAFGVEPATDRYEALLREGTWARGGEDTLATPQVLPGSG